MIPTPVATSALCPASLCEARFACVLVSLASFAHYGEQASVFFVGGLVIESPDHGGYAVRLLISAQIRPCAILRDEQRVTLPPATQASAFFRPGRRTGARSGSTAASSPFRPLRSALRRAFLTPS